MNLLPRPALALHLVYNRPKSLSKLEADRFKGLDEMTATQLKETTILSLKRGDGLKESWDV